MAYTLQWLPAGVVKHYSGAVTFEDIIKSEYEIAGSSRFTELRFVIFDYMNAHIVGLTENQRQEVRAQRIGGFYTNPRIKYAFATQDYDLKTVVEKSVKDGHALHETRVFPTLAQAYSWANS